MPGRLRILVVDDEPTNLLIASTILEFAGFEVTCCENGQEALAWVFERQVSFDAVVLDILMPLVDGLDVARALRAAPATQGIPIVCVSARASGSDAKAGRAAGCDRYITKPYRRKELLDAIQLALDAHGC